MTYVMFGAAEVLTDAVTNLPMFDPSIFVRVDTRQLDNGGLETLYRQTGLDPAYPVTVRIGVYPKVKDGVPYWNVSFRANLWVERTIGEEVDTLPGDIVFAWNLPFAPVPVASEMLSLLGMVFSFAARDVTADVLTTAYLGTYLSSGVTDQPLADVIRTDA